MNTNTKSFLITAASLLLLFLACYLWATDHNRLVNDSKAQQLADTGVVHYYKNKLGQEVATKQAYLTTISGLKETLTKDSLLILLKKEVNNNTISGTTASSVNTSSITQKTDTQFVATGDSNTCPTYLDSLRTMWSHWKLSINCKTTSFIDTSFDTLSVITGYSSIKLFKPNTWFNRTINTSITNSNPGIHITGMQSYVKDKKRVASTWGKVGIAILAGIGLEKYILKL